MKMCGCVCVKQCFLMTSGSIEKRHAGTPRLSLSRLSLFMCNWLLSCAAAAFTFLLKWNWACRYVFLLFHVCRFIYFFFFFFSLLLLLMFDWFLAYTHPLSFSSVTYSFHSLLASAIFCVCLLLLLVVVVVVGVIVVVGLVVILLLLMFDWFSPYTRPLTYSFHPLFASAIFLCDRRPRRHTPPPHTSTLIFTHYKSHLYTPLIAHSPLFFSYLFFSFTPWHCFLFLCDRRPRRHTPFLTVSTQIHSCSHVTGHTHIHS